MTGPSTLLGHTVLLESDAIHTQRTLQRQLQELPWKDVPQRHRQRHRGHGRTGSRTIRAATIAAGILFPHAAQAAQITRRSRKTNGTTWSVETVYIITSLPAGAAELNALVQGHWTIRPLTSTLH